MATCENGACAGKIDLAVSTAPTALCGNELYKRFKESVVQISVVPKFNISVAGVFEAPPVPYTNVFPILPLNFSGFFYEKDGFIVGSSGFLYSVVLALYYYYYPFFTATTITAITPVTNNVLPTIDQVLAIIFDPANPRSLADFFDVFITVYNVNGCGSSYVYRGYIVGVDFETGVAVFKIDRCDLWNKCAVPILKFPYLKFGISKCYGPGNPAHIIATFADESPQGMASGSIVLNTNKEVMGLITYESVVTDINVVPGVEGAPILDQCGYVVGVVTGITNVPDPAGAIRGVPYEGHTAFGVSAAFIKPVVENLIEANLNPGCTPFALYNDIYGFNLYRHGSLGLCYYYRTGTDIGVLSADVVYPPPIERWYDPAYCQINRQLIGILVRQVTGSLAEAIENCTRQDFPPFASGKTIPTLPPGFVGWQIQPLDLITGINGMQVGLTPTQVTPDTILYCLQACCTVSVDFMKASESYTQCHSLCTELDDSLSFLFQIPPVVATLQANSGNLASLQTISETLLVWFFNSLPLVYRAVFMDQLNAIYHPITTGTAVIQTQLNQINSATDTTVVPALQFNLTYLNTICVSTRDFPNSLINLLNLA